MVASISDNDILAASAEVLTADLSSDGDSSLVILGLHDGIYYELKGIGVRFWQLVQEPRSFREILDAILTEYEVSREQCAADLGNLIPRLVDLGLVSVRRVV